MIHTKEIPLDSITLNPDFIRTQSNVQKYQELKDSIKQKGIIYPLITIQTTDQLLLVAGYRRFQAAKDLGLPSVPCYCLQVGMDDAEIMRLHENLFREDITPTQEAAAFIRLEHTYHFTREKIAKLIGKSKSYVTQKIQILTWPTPLQQALADSHISYSVARELSVVDDQRELNRLLELCLTSGATVRTVLGWIQEWRTTKIQLSINNKPIDQSAESNSSDTANNKCQFCGSTPLDQPPLAYYICTDCAVELGLKDHPPNP